MGDFLPTHHCFDDALDYLTERVKAHPALARKQTLILVHGIARSTIWPTLGEPYAHAWCEENGCCWDAALYHGERVYYSVVKAEYYAARQVQETTRYTIRQAVRENYRTNHYGPWKPEYLALCGTSRQVLGIMSTETKGATIRTW